MTWGELRRLTAMINLCISIEGATEILRARAQLQTAIDTTADAYHHLRAALKATGEEPPV